MMTMPAAAPPPETNEAALEAAMLQRYPALAEPRVAARLLAACRVAARALDERHGPADIRTQLHAAIALAEAGAARPQ